MFGKMEEKLVTKAIYKNVAHIPCSVGQDGVSRGKQQHGLPRQHVNNNKHLPSFWQSEGY